MDSKKQKLLFEYLISSPDIFALCSSIVKPQYFDPEYRNAVSFVHEYYEQYHSIPTNEQIEAETGNVFNLHKITTDQFAYTADEIEKFCKQKAMEQAVLSSVPHIEKGEYGNVEELIKEAVTVSLNRNLGTDYFLDPDLRLKLAEESGDKISTGWPQVDAIMFGGLERGELLVFSANSGGGKSIALSNLGLNFLEQGLNVVYFSFELSEKLIAQRYDTMISGVSTAEWKYHKEKITESVLKTADKSGHFVIKQYPPGTKPMQLRAYLKEYELKFNRTPDLIIVDYLDIMDPNERVSADNAFEKDKRVSEQIRAIAMDYNAIAASASQQNRQGVDATEISQAHVAGGISKVNTSDWWISVIANHTMRASNECAFQFLKTRNSDGVGSVVYLTWTKNIRILDEDSKKEQLSFKKKSDKVDQPWLDSMQEDNGPKSDLLDCFD